MPRLTLDLSDDDWRALRAMAEADCRSVTGQVRSWIRREAAARGMWSARKPVTVIPSKTRKTGQ